MKRIRRTLLLLPGLLLLSLTAHAFELEAPTQYFYAADYADVLESEHEQYYVDQGAALQEATGAQIVVASVPSLHERTVEEYANTLFRSWGIGDSEKNNGLLILLAPNERQIRVEVGYGLEGALNDSKVTRYMDEYAVPYLAQDQFDEGIYNLYNALLPAVYEEYGLTPPESVQSAVAAEGDDSSPMDFIIALVLVALVFGVFFRRRRHFGGHWGGGFYGGGGFHGGGFGGGFSGGGGGGFSGGGGSSGGGGGSRGF